MTGAVKSGDAVPLEHELALIRTAAEEAGRIALAYFRGQKAMDVRMKGGVSPVSAADLAADTFLREFLTKARPQYGWLSEESTDASRTRRFSAPRTFIVDPIDGTRGFIEGRRTWCVSVALVEDGRAVAGVLECPALDATYHALAGGGAFRGGERISTRPLAARPVIAGPKSFAPKLEAAFPGYKHHAHVPSLAYRLAMVAEGTLDATLVKPNAHDWDIAAANLILDEAGGRLCDFQGNPVILNTETVVKPGLVAGSVAALDAVLGVVRDAAFE